ncbi:MAG: DUF2442 domain-containing protein [Luteitalea sp.]|nr:DUF2442 domain-containing protein [Luteitalea sp.]
MKSETLGRHTSQIEVTNVSPHGFWILIEERELFVPFGEFPWFRESSIREIANVQLSSPHHLHWPDLDIDLAVESLDHPEKFPLVSRVQPVVKRRLEPPPAHGGAGKKRGKR